RDLHYLILAEERGIPERAASVLLAEVVNRAPRGALRPVPIGSSERAAVRLLPRSSLPTLIDDFDRRVHRRQPIDDRPGLNVVDQPHASSSVGDRADIVGVGEATR